MSRIYSILVLTVLLLPQGGSAADYKQNWKKATEYYSHKEYDSAAFYFERVAVLNPQNPELYYNLGNSYYRLNKIALAVLNYERALFLNPEYKDAQENLSITHARIAHYSSQVEDIFFIDWWKGLTSHTRATAWAIAALITFVLIVSAFWLRRFWIRGASIPVQTPWILAFICFFFLLFGFVAAQNSQQSPGAVVMENDAPLMNEQLKGKPIALIPEGTVIRVIEERGMWVEVSLPDSRSGWVLKSQITNI